MADSLYDKNIPVGKRMLTKRPMIVQSHSSYTTNNQPQVYVKFGSSTMVHIVPIAHHTDCHETHRLAKMES